MNNKVFLADIIWVSKEDGGRKTGVPLGIKLYAPLIAINDDKIFEGSTWSLLCYSFKKINDLQTKAYIRFLNIDAAPDILHEGLKFELYEGAKKVANGEVLEETEFDF